MKATYRTNALDFEFDAETMTEVFKQLHMFQDVFADLKCYWDGKSSPDTKFVVRTNDDDDEFFELWYNGTNPHFFGCKKQFGCHKKGGGLFPKYRDKDGNALAPDIYKNRGWTKYNKETGKLE